MKQFWTWEFCEKKIFFIKKDVYPWKSMNNVYLKNKKQEHPWFVDDVNSISDWFQ